MKRIVLATALAVSLSAHAGFFTGNDLYSKMTSSDFQDRALAMGYVLSVHDSTSGVTICSPDQVTSGQVRDMVQDFLRQYPAIRAESAFSITYNFLTKVWPCAQKKSSFY